MNYDFDLFVIGGGSGGVRSARLAAEKGLRVGLAEGDRMGGTCVIRGCVPKKLMLYASDFGALTSAADGFGWKLTDLSHDWRYFQDKLTNELKRLETIYENIMQKNNVRLFKEFARFKDKNHITLAGGDSFSAKHILIATGGRPFVPEFSGNEYALVSDDVFNLTAMPKNILVVGGGYIASEFANILLGLGANVTQAYRGDLILKGFDQEVRELVVKSMRARGVNFMFNQNIQKIEKKGSSKIVTFDDLQTQEFDEVLYATGRVPNIENLGLEQAGINVEKGAVKVNEYSQTNIDNIYAIGDVTARAALTPVAIREGVNFIKTVYEDTPSKVDYSKIPTAIFTRPEIGTMGMSEEKARQAGYEVDIYSTQFTPMLHSFAGGSEKMFMKLVVDKISDKILGAHIVGEGAGEMIQILGIPMTMGVTKSQFDATIAVHPTAAEELVTMRKPNN